MTPQQFQSILDFINDQIVLIKINKEQFERMQFELSKNFSIKKEYKNGKLTECIDYSTTFNLWQKCCASFSKIDNILEFYKKYKQIHYETIESTFKNGNDELETSIMDIQKHIIFSCIQNNL